MGNVVNKAHNVISRFEVVIHIFHIDFRLFRLVRMAPDQSHYIGSLDTPLELRFPQQARVCGLPVIE